MQIILNDNLQMRRVSAKFIPRHLFNEQKKNCVSVCTKLKNRLDADTDFMTKIITGKIRVVCIAMTLRQKFRVPSGKLVFVLVLRRHVCKVECRGYAPFFIVRA